MDVAASVKSDLLQLHRGPPSLEPHTAAEPDGTVCHAAVDIARDGTSPQALPGGALIYTGHCWTSTHGPTDPHDTPSLSFCASRCHAADEMFFNTQSTVLTSPRVAGSPLGAGGIDFGGDCGTVVSW